jgi:HEAT repeat protein
VPGPVLPLGLTANPRCIPLLRRALLSPNYMIEVAGAMGLAETHDNTSIPLTIHACQKAPPDDAQVLAKSLVYFDASGAQNAVDQFIPKQTQVFRNVKAGGKKRPLSYGVLILELAP